MNKTIPVKTNNPTIPFTYGSSFRKSLKFFFDFQILENSQRVPAPGYLKIKMIIVSRIISIFIQ